jgi:tetratricopeptide (TPR) repeat protein
LRWRLPGSILVLGLALAAVFEFVALARTNANSLVVERAFFVQPTTASFPDLPRGNTRFGLWSGLYALSQNNAPAAVDALQTVGRERSLSQLEWVVLGRAYLAERSLDQAIGAWAMGEAWPEMVRAAEQSDNDRQWANALILVSAARPKLPREVVSSEARARRGLGNPEAVLEILVRAKAIWPDAPESTVWLLYQGDALFDLKRWDESREAYQQASASDDRGLAYWGLLGVGRASYRSGSGLNAAAAPILQAISLEPNNRAAYSTMAELLRAERRTDDALIWDRRAAVASATDNSYTPSRGK